MAGHPQNGNAGEPSAKNGKPSVPLRCAAAGDAALPDDERRFGEVDRITEVVLPGGHEYIAGRFRTGGQAIELAQLAAITALDNEIENA